MSMFAFENTSMENYEGHYGAIRDFFNEQGYEVGGNWEYDHGYFDKKLADHPGYLFVRIPVTAQVGEFGQEDAVVKIGRPFVLRHKYQIGLDDHADVTVATGSINQFSEPQDPDASLKQEDVELATTMIEQLNGEFRGQFLT